MNARSNIKVWDLVVRLFHWSLVVAFFIAYFTDEDSLDPHVWAGYIVLALVMFRVLWGFIGTPYARFSSFVFSFATIKKYLTETLLLRAKRYIGHNPAGGAMIMLLLFSLIVTSLSGIAIYGIEENSGPLAPWLSHAGEFWEELAEETHELFANFTLFLVFIHLVGVVIESLIHKENLVRAMINGYKRAQS